MHSLKIKNVDKLFVDFVALNKINISIETGQFLVLVGPSGCGKSTLLNMIAGLEPVSKGEIFIGEKNITKLEPKDRNIAMVFQSYALYPNMNVYNNIAFCLKIAKQSVKKQKETVARIAKILQIEPLLDRKPSQLSGGQRQRVAMGRALARDPAVFLFDEPLSNLDAKLRIEMRREIKKLHNETNSTIVYVTHDQIEAMTLADIVVVMKDGEIQQTGTPKEIYRKPNNMFVAGFIGSPMMNFISTKVVKQNNKICLQFKIGFSECKYYQLEKSLEIKLSKYLNNIIIIGIRPEQISEHSVMEKSLKVSLVVDDFELTGPDTYVVVKLNNHNVTCRVSSITQIAIGNKVDMIIDMSRVVFFDKNSENRIA